MSGKPFPGRRERMSARISRLQDRVSSLFPCSAPVSPPSSPHSRLPENDAERRDTLAPFAKNQLSPASASASASHHPSISNDSVRSAANLIPARSSPSPQRFAHHWPGKASADQNHSSTLLVPPSPLSLPQEQISTIREPSHSENHGMFNGSSNFSVSGGTFINIGTAADNFMKDFLQATIIGAEFDSSDRDPPPRCHPGTRSAIIQRCLDFIFESSGQEKLRWVVGAAGVGKSAVMQIVAEQAPHGAIFASVFLSVNGRRDGTKTIATVAYQLAVKCDLYRRFIQDEITRDPSLLRKSLSVHFKRFIAEPFIHQRLFDPSNRFLIIIDGLDECENPLAQRELLRLISDFCINYPISPVVWIVASRPEPHITSFFDDVRVKPTYTKEEIMIDSDEACNDVQRYLHAELNKIQLEYPSLKHKREWPSEPEFTIIATTAGGLFAYASTVVRYIGDPHHGDPAARLHYLLEVIDAGGKDDHDMLRRDHPMAQLDALYARILSNIPSDAMINARKLLLQYSSLGWPGRMFRLECNMLGLTEDAAYGAVRHLYAVMKIPEPCRADDERLTYLHKSFEDFLFDFKRSGFSTNVQHEVEQLSSQMSWRVIEEVPDDFDAMSRGGGIECGTGYLQGGPESCRKISLSWPGDERFQECDDLLRLQLYNDAMTVICGGFSADSHFYGSMPSFHALTTRFTVPPIDFPFDKLRDSAFDEFRHELAELGRLKRVLLRTLDYAAICGGIELRFTSPIGVDVDLSDPWNPSCHHGKRELDGLQMWQGWTTQFGRFVKHDVTDTDIPRFNVAMRKESHRKSFRVFGPGNVDQCDYCLRRFARQFMSNIDQLATVFVDSTEMSYVEVLLVDADDGVSEWRYRFFHSGPPDVCR